MEFCSVNRFSAGRRSAPLQLRWDCRWLRCGARRHHDRCPGRPRQRLYFFPSCTFTHSRENHSLCFSSVLLTESQNRLFVQEFRRDKSHAATATVSNAAKYELPCQCSLLRLGNLMERLPLWQLAIVSDAENECMPWVILFPHFKFSKAVVFSRSAGARMRCVFLRRHFFRPVKARS
jgi:hypothetical protein